MFKYLLGISFFCSVFFFNAGHLFAQCDNPTVPLPDASHPVNGNPSLAYCVTLSFDPNTVDCLPNGIQMDLTHTFEGDLSIALYGNGEILNVMQRPGAIGNCAGGSPFGSPANVAGTFIFQDGGGADPEDGLGTSGGTFDVTTDDDCGVSTLGAANSFAGFFATFPPGPITVDICIDDHAFADVGVAADISFVFPCAASFICGCTDPDAINYDPAATVDDGSCFYDCPDLGLDVAQDYFEFCAGTNSFTLAGDAPLANNPSYEWTATNGGDAYINNIFSANTTVNIPDDFDGNIIFTLTVIDDFGCEEMVDVELNVGSPPDVEIDGPDEVCVGEEVEIFLIGGPYAEIEWTETGETTESISVGPGTYNVTVEDAFGCTNTAEYTVDAFPNVAPLIFGPDEICEFNGFALLEANDFYVSYEWSTGENTFDIEVTESGEYSLTVEDENGCFGETFYTLEEAPPVVVNITGDQAICEGEQTLLMATFGFDSYEWDTGEITPDIYVSDAGTYSVTVVNDIGCTGEASFEVTVNPLPEPMIVGPDIVCLGVNISLSTDQTYSSYSWSTGSASQSTFVSEGGVVSVTVTDNQGCSEETEIEILEGELVDAEIQGDLFFCPGSETLVTATEGYDTYAWSNGEDVNEIMIDEAGQYEVTITSSDGCTQELIIDVEELDAPMPEITGVDYICFESNTSLSVENIYDSYEWSTGDITNEINVDETDTYTITVTDGFGCEGEDDFMLTVGEEIIPTIIGPEELCPNAFSEISIVGSFSSVDWSTGVSNSNISPIVGPGDYSVDVFDNNLCPGTASIFIEETEPEPVDIIGLPEMCEGTSQILSTTGDFATFEWSTDETSATINITDAGNYWVLAIDEDGCESFNTFDVGLSPALMPSIMGDLEICPDGSTVLSTELGFDSYTWSGGVSTNEQLTVTAPGEYSVTVMNDDGCVGEAMVTVEELVSPMPEIQGDLILCEGEISTLSLSQNYDSYSWSTTSTDPTIDIDQGITYSVTVTDVDGCVGEDTVTAEDIEVSVEITGDNDFCEGMNTTLSVPATFSSYAWSTGGNTNEITTTTAGNIDITVTDENGCTAIDDIDITVFPLPEIEIIGDLDFCEGLSTSLGVNGDYESYTWSNDSTDPSITVLEGGAYSVEVVDEFGCTGEATAMVQELALPTPEIQGDLILCEGEISTLSLSQNYDTYSWSTTSTDPTIDIDEGISYSVTVTDGNGCIGEDMVTAEDIEISVEITGDNDFCEGMNTTLSVPATFSTYAWSIGGDTNEITTTTAGNIDITVTDENGCTATDNIDITVFPLPEVEITGRFSYCPQGATQLNATPGYPTYLWSNNDNTSSIQVSEETNFSVTVTDANGCQNDDSVFVVEEEELDIEIIGDFDFCEGLSTNLGVEGDYESYSWSNDSTDPDITVSEGGTYSVVVTDEFGCTGQDIIDVVSNPLPEPMINGDLNFCIGDSTQLSTGSFESYSWSITGLDTQFVVIDLPELVGLTVTDENGCIGSTTAQLVEDPLPVHTIQGVPGFCPDESTTLSGEDGFDIYQWSTASNASSIAVDQSQTYQLSVTDGNGCIGVASIDVSEYTTAIPNIQGALQFCPDGSTNLSISNSFENYNWTTGESTNSINIDDIGDVGILVTDANECVTENSVELSLFDVVPPVIDAPEGFCTGLSATLTATAGYDSYAWSNTENTETISITDGGLYSLDVIDVNGCPSDAVVSVTEYDLPTPEIGGSLTFCTGLSTTLNPGGVYTAYVWSTGDTESEVIVSSPGNIGLTVTDENTCVGSTSELVEEALELSPVISGELDFCTGETTELSAGNGFETYEWSTGSENSSIIVTMPGMYSLSVTDAGGCNGTAMVEVIENELPQPGILGLLAFCEGLETELSSDNVYPTYAWSTGEPTPSITVNAANDYVLTVIDENDCTNSVMVAVAEQPLPQFGIVGDDEFCISSSTQLSIEPAYAQYDWSVGSGQQSVTVGEAGIVAVTVTDDFGCESSQNIQLSTVALPIADPGALQILDCEILAVELGGSSNPVGNYSYSWSGPGIDASSTSLSTLENPEVGVEGEYALIITNEDFDCESLPALVNVVDEAFVPQIVLEVVDILDCRTETVQIDARESDMGQSFVYQWFDGTLTPIQDANSLVYTATSAQFYTLQILDTITNCSDTMSIEVEENDAYPFAEAGLPQLITCSSPTVPLNGTASEQGGQIQFTWTSPEGSFVSNPNIDSVEVNSGGYYYLQVEDILNGCSNIDSVLVTDIIEYPIAMTSDDFELDCIEPNTIVNGMGSSSGSIYTYQWLDNQSIIEGATNLELEVNNPGVYTLRVTNTENDCVAQEPVNITLNPAAPQSLDYLMDRPTCAGDDDGSILLHGTVGGTPPFEYSVDGGAFGGLEPYENLTAGVYPVIVRDATGCLLETEVEVIDGNDLTLDLGPDQYLEEGELADIYPEISIDSSKLVSIDWQPSFLLDCPSCIYQFDLKLNESTQFFLSLKDENGCTIDDDITIFINKERPIYVPSAFSPNDDGDNDIFYIFSGLDNVKVHQFLVFNRWGEAVFEVYNSWPNDPRWGWDGKHRGQPVNSAVYVWFAEVEFPNGDVEVIKGDVIVMH